MTPHHLGQELRQLVLRERREGRAVDPRRLQAAVGDLCGGEHADLLAPLRYLVLSTAFASAAGQDPPLGDPRLLARLQQELAQMYAVPLCQRLQPVLEGLLGIAPSAASPSPAPAPGPTPQAAVPAASMAAPPVRRSGLSALNLALAGLSGMLLMVLVGLGVWLQQRPQQAISPAALPPAGAPAVPAGRPVEAPPAAPEATSQADADAAPSGPANEAAGSEPPEAAAAALDRSLASVNALYDALSAKDYGRARDLFGPGAADQFEPAFFDQFARVSVQDLRLIGQSGSTLNLEGVVTFIYPDGTIQTESRTFTLESSGEPPRIMASEFGRVIKPR